MSVRMTACHIPYRGFRPCQNSSGDGRFHRLLFRCGDFYETYKDDAVKASKILGITLTKSNGRKDDEGKPLAMAGFPYHALDTYLPKLIRAGERVAICDQLEMPKQTTSSKRGITEMVSPGKETGKQMAQESQETEQHTSLRR